MTRRNILTELAKYIYADSEAARHPFGPKLETARGDFFHRLKVADYRYGASPATTLITVSRQKKLDAM